jgi:integrase
LTLEQLGAYWREQRVNRSGQPLSPKTASEYERLITSTLAVFRSKPIRSITTEQIERWRAPEIKRAPNQTTKAYKHLKTLLTWAHKRLWILENPCTIERGTSYRSKEPEVPTLEQVRLMLELAPAPFSAILQIAAWGGLRKGEILELRRKDFERETHADKKLLAVLVKRTVIWDKGRPIVKEPKTIKSARRILLPPGASKVIEAHLKTISLDPEALLFSRRLEGVDAHLAEDSIKLPWNKLREQVGFDGTFHSLRGFHLTQVGLQGASLQELMDRAGHSNIQTAMRYQRSTGRDAQLISNLG